MNDYMTARAYLSDLLHTLHLAPELLLHAGMHARLTEAIDTYKARHASYPDTLGTPQSSPPQPLDSATPAPQSPKPPPPNAPEHKAPPVTLVESVMRATPPPLSDPTPPQTQEGGLSAGTLVMIELIPDMFESLGEDLEHVHLITKLERLERWSSRDDYRDLDVERRRELAHYLVARLRSVQDPLPHYDATAHKERFRHIAHTIKHTFQSTGQHVGYIYGLRTDDDPAHGDSWKHDAAHWKTLLEHHITPPDYDEAHEPSRTKKSPSGTSTIPSEVPESLEAFVPALRGKRILCAGGVSKPHQHRNIEAWFAPEELVWVESEKDKGMRHVQRECDRIKAHHYDIVCLFVDAMSHAESEALVEACKAMDGKVHSAIMTGGFGPGAWHGGLTRATPALLTTHTS